MAPKLMLCLLATACMQMVNAQQLNFSQAIVIKLSGPGGPMLNLLNDTILTVPTGKVWKVESIAIGTEKDFVWSGGVVYTPYQAGCYVTLDGTVIAPALSDQPGLRISPIWLPAGAYTLELWQEDGNNSSAHRTLVSILEFSL
jgi:hypothetical protein